MALIPPTPVGALPGSAFWNDWIEKIRTVVNDILTTGLNWTNITGTPTTLAGYGITDGVELTANKNAASGYAGLTSSRITKGAITTDDLIVDNAAKGLVLKDTQGTPHYWRVTVDNTGTLVISDLGTSAP
jgi:hypothetical protein